jgi:nitrogen fixation NifU-like protein
MYSEKVMDHFMNPRNVGVIEGADGEGTEGNPTCGDVMKFTIKVKDGRIEDAKFQTFGCGAAIAVSSMVTEMVKGKTLEEALAISKETVARELGGLPPQKMHCSNLGADALRKAIEDYRNRQGAPAAAEKAEAAPEEPAKAAKPARKAAQKAPGAASKKAAKGPKKTRK